ncbi:MAG TPA: GNAT family N-acetyltransferase, partial [Arenibacter sp.]|nr:GNAT family N-acetyltransferase [Arenibacter sp.]
MIEIIRTNSQNPKFKNLVQSLNKDIAKRDGGTHALSQFNSIADLKHVVLA